MKDAFCNTCCLTEAIPKLIAEELLGIRQLDKLKARYEQMRKCYDFSYADWQEAFTDELKPFRGYTDTTSVVIPVSHPLFRQDFDSLNKGAIGIDLPTWFNMQADVPRIMFVAQDPLRSNKWYGECSDVVVSSPFAQHDATHRNHGGRMVNLLFERLTDKGYGLYLTDAHKFFIYDSVTSGTYSKSRQGVYVEILSKEMELVCPELCVCLGNKAKECVNRCGVEVRSISLPHLSGTARGAIIRRFPVLKEMKATVENVTSVYVDEIIKLLKV